MDAGWNTLYRVGAVAALIAVSVFRRNFSVELVQFKGFRIICGVPATWPSSAMDWFALLQDNAFVGLVLLNVVDLINYCLVGLIFLALYGALRQAGKSAIPSYLSTKGVEMSANQLRAAGAVLFYLSIFVSGFWLTRSGKPYNQIVFNVHKLIALVAVVLFAATLYQVNRVVALNAVDVGVSVVTGLLFLSLFVTGALVSIDNPMPAIVAKLHHIIPYLAVHFTAATLYLLLRKL